MASTSWLVIRGRQAHMPLSRTQRRRCLTLASCLFCLSVCCIGVRHPAEQGPQGRDGRADRQVGRRTYSRVACVCAIHVVLRPFIDVLVTHHARSSSHLYMMTGIASPPSSCRVKPISPPPRSCNHSYSLRTTHILPAFDHSPPPDHHSYSPLPLSCHSIVLAL